MPDEPDQRDRELSERAQRQDRRQREQDQRERDQIRRQEAQDRREIEQAHAQGVGFTGFGISLSVTGIYTIIILLLCIFLVAAGYFAMKSFAVVRDDHDRMMVEIKILSYLISLPEITRPRLIPPAGFFDRISPRKETPSESRRRKERERDPEADLPGPIVPFEERLKRWEDTGNGGVDGPFLK